MTRRGFLSRRDHFLDGVRADDLGALGLVVEEVVHLGDGAVVGGHGEAVVVHVQNQVLAHNGQPDYSNVSFRFHSVCFVTGTPDGSKVRTRGQQESRRRNEKLGGRPVRS